MAIDTAFPGLVGFLQSHVLEEKVFVVPSYRIGHQIGEALAAQGFSWINLRFVPLPALANEVAGETLAEAAAHVEKALGVALSPGGVHVEMGTHNRLLSLGPGLYLEAIAVNPDARAPEGTAPPLVVMLHGGPTSQARTSLSLQRQAFTSRAPRGRGLEPEGAGG